MEMGLGMMEGGRKYGTHNYRSMGVLTSVYYDAAMRHLMSYWEGEDIDPDSGLSHITKALSCLSVLRDSQLMGNCKDDRPIRLPNGLDVGRLNAKASEIIDKYPEPKEPYTQARKVKEHRADRYPCPATRKTRDVCPCLSCRGIRKIELNQESKHEAGKFSYDGIAAGQPFDIDRLCKCDTCRPKWQQNNVH
jgi:hypothetical protein